MFHSGSKEFMLYLDGTFILFRVFVSFSSTEVYAGYTIFLTETLQCCCIKSVSFDTTAIWLGFLILCFGQSQSRCDLGNRA